MKKDEYIISIIIPVFNAEETILETLLSLTREATDDIEFIIINDNSTDSSKQVIEDFLSKKTLNIKLLNNKSKGVSSARNAGLAVAQGKYISFTDADDLIKHGYFNKIKSIISNASPDIIYFRHSVLVKAGIFLQKYYFKESKLVSSNFFCEHLAVGLVTNSVCDKVFRKKLLHSNTINFPENSSIAEDAAFTAVAASHAAEIYISIDDFYIYNNLNSGTMRTGLTLKMLSSVYSSIKYIQSNVKASKKMLFFPNFEITLCLPYIMEISPALLKSSNEFSNLTKTIRNYKIDKIPPLKILVITTIFKIFNDVIALKIIQFLHKSLKPMVSFLKKLFKPT